MPTGDEWIARAESWIPSLFERATEVSSADKAYAWMREHDMYVPRAYVREAWGNLRSGEEYIGLVNRLGTDAAIPRSWYTTSHSRIPTRYRYIIEVGGFSVELNDVLMRSAAIDSDSPLTIGEITDQAAELLVRYGIEVSPDIAPVTISRVFHTSGAAW